jgi:hypothetical protein
MSPSGLHLSVSHRWFRTSQRWSGRRFGRLSVPGRRSCCENGHCSSDAHHRYHYSTFYGVRRPGRRPIRQVRPNSPHGQCVASQVVGALSIVRVMHCILRQWENVRHIEVRDMVYRFNRPMKSANSNRFRGLFPDRRHFKKIRERQHLTEGRFNHSPSTALLSSNCPIHWQDDSRKGYLAEAFVKVLKLIRQ